MSDRHYCAGCGWRDVADPCGWAPDDGEEGLGPLACLRRPDQPATGYQKNVTPRGPIVRPADAFPPSCCEGGPNDG